MGSFKLKYPQLAINELLVGGQDRVSDVKCLITDIIFMCASGRGVGSMVPRRLLWAQLGKHLHVHDYP